MNHLKKLGLMALALTAVMAVAGVASASASQFTASSTGIGITGGQTTEHVFSVEGSEVTCETAEFTGETESTASANQKAHPAYSGCTAFGFAAAEVDTTGCDYNFDANGSAALEGCTNGYITINVESIFNTRCHVKVHDGEANSAINGISYTDNGGTVTVTAAANNISAEIVTSTGFCPLTVGTSNTAKYSGSTLVTPASGSIGWDA